MRERVLRENRHRCQNCSRYGRLRDATTVHHVNPIEERPELRMTRWNLVALCDECHNKMHDRTTHKLTELGERWRFRVTPPCPNGQLSGWDTGQRELFPIERS